ncbi:MAG TPA: hypothetical protein VFH68_18340 [Polyangia bacterium]|nr:hypothetical protein [Polyangia bacterium]
MWRRRIFRGTALIGAASAISLACSSSTPIDMYYGTDAGAGFEAPPGVGGSSGQGGDDAGDDTGGAGGSAGATGSDAGSDTGSDETAETAP